MMMVSAKQLSEISARVESARLRQELGLTRRAQALLAGCGEVEQSRPWYVLTVQHGCEKDVDKLLGEVGIDRWLPTLEVETRRRSRYGGGKPGKQKKPVWPGYMFVRSVNSATSWAALQRVDGILGVLGTAERPAPIHDDIVLKLKLKLEHDPQARDILTKAIKVGEQVRVSDGPFASFLADVKKLLGFDHVKVEVNIFGRLVPVQLELAQLEKIG